MSNFSKRVKSIPTFDPIQTSPTLSIAVQQLRAGPATAQPYIDDAYGHRTVLDIFDGGLHEQSAKSN
jgi:hypothetical protein